jgi:predicted nucleic acid-binding protein
MRYVLDSNVALKWVLSEPDSTNARLLRSEFQQQVHELFAPDIFAIEVAHALARAELRGFITRAQGRAFVTNILSTPPQLEPYLPLLSRAYQIASQARIGVYDCVYVALAEREGCDLVAADSRLINSLQPSFPIIRSLTSL